MQVFPFKGNHGRVSVPAGQPGSFGHGDDHSDGGSHGGSHRRLKYSQNKDDTYGDDELHRVWISASWNQLTTTTGAICDLYCLRWNYS